MSVHTVNPVSVHTVKPVSPPCLQHHRGLFSCTAGKREVNFCLEQLRHTPFNTDGVRRAGGVKGRGHGAWGVGGGWRRGVLKQPTALRSRPNTTHSGLVSSVSDTMHQNEQRLQNVMTANYSRPQWGRKKKRKKEKEKKVGGGVSPEHPEP